MWFYLEGWRLLYVFKNYTTVRFNIIEISMIIWLLHVKSKIVVTYIKLAEVLV